MRTLKVPSALSLMGWPWTLTLAFGSVAPCTMSSVSTRSQKARSCGTLTGLNSPGENSPGEARCRSSKAFRPEGLAPMPIPVVRPNSFQ